MKHKLFRNISLAIVSIFGISATGVTVNYLCSNEQYVKAEAVDVLLAEYYASSYMTTVRSESAAINNFYWSFNSPCTPSFNNNTLTVHLHYDSTQPIYRLFYKNPNSKKISKVVVEFAKQAGDGSLSPVDVYLGGGTYNANRWNKLDSVGTTRSEVRFTPPDNFDLNNQKGLVEFQWGCNNNSSGHNDFDTYFYSIKIYEEVTNITVTFNQQNGSGGTSSTSATPGSAMPSITLPTRNGYDFAGYFSEANGGGTKYYNSNGTSAHTCPASNITLYAYWTLKAEIQNVIDEINAIGDVVYPDSREGILDARNDYEDLSSTYKALVNNYSTLENDETQYATLRTNAINATKGLISNIGEVSYPESKEDIVAAEAAYNYLYSGDRSEIDNYDTLTAARNEFDELRAAAIEMVIETIDNIGDINYPGSKEALEYAEDLYSHLHNDDKNSSVITNQDVMLDDRTNYNNQRNSAVDQVIANINAISEPFDLDNYDDEISTARNSYEALDEDEKNTTWVTNYQRLLDAEAAQEVTKEILAIDSSKDPDEYKEAILEAREHYDALTEDQKSFVPSGVVKVLTDNEEAYPVVKLIDDIGDLTYDGGDNDSLDAIIEAEEAYNALTDDQKKLVDEANHNTLLYDRDTYDNTKETCDYIADIGKVTLSDTSKAKLEKAREKYDTLNDEAKELVKNYNNSYKTLDDGEHVYETLVKIDAIGEVSYDTLSKERIDEARRMYNSLTGDQKALIDAEFLKVLEDSEATYEQKQTTGNVIVILFLIISCLLLIIGSILLYCLIKERTNNDDDDDNGGSTKNKPVKTMSFPLPLILVAVGTTSHYLDAPFIALYIIAGLTILVWLTDLILYFFFKPKGVSMKDYVKGLLKNLKPKKKEAKDDEEVITVTDANGNKFQIRYIKSFTAKLIQASDESKAYYEQLKNEALSYKGVTSRVSWHYDSINFGREQVMKFAIKGKTLCVFYALNPDEYLDSKYKVEKSEVKKFTEVPCLYRIKNDRRRDYAKELIKVVMAKYGLEKGEEKHESYILPYEDNKPLIARGLIKELKVPVNKPAEIVLDYKNDEEGNEVITTKDETGHVYETRYVKSFTARYIQSTDEAKDFYTELKNYALSYNVTSRVSWLYDSINNGKEQLLKFNVRGKTLCIYYALDVDKLGEKYKVEKSLAKKYSKVPCLYRINNARRLNYAKELIDRVMKKYKLEKEKESHEDFHLPYEDKEALISKGYIRKSRVLIK